MRIPIRGAMDMVIDTIVIGRTSMALFYYKWGNRRPYPGRTGSSTLFSPWNGPQVRPGGSGVKDG